MEGQFGDTSFSNMYSNAGVVPRAVEHVFKHLEENDLEYQVWTLTMQTKMGNLLLCVLGYYRSNCVLNFFLHRFGCLS